MMGLNKRILRRSFGGDLDEILINAIIKRLSELQAQCRDNFLEINFENNLWGVVLG